ncbi:putative outer membrane starch-binding protein [Chitinophaga polysaccharea]|uniref:Putative outer membrane starch-binding protein n=1 Tax=Chitinophaga polysaccharea TaxID=1293035 RepID=A0A561PQS4_9BACT|nr:RagB/SusD family nutrient uptake outer membrane protein [Chitinophaga polysaccharea]TWF40421.1 putative outer membrane starch-binding protein [Chitinophaga polysaccharea]
MFKYFPILMAGIIFMEFTACSSPAVPFSNSFNKDSLSLLVSDSALMDALVEDAYEKILPPLYYNASSTDDRTDNIYFDGPNPVVIEKFDSTYTSEWDQMDKIRQCDEVERVIGKNSSIGAASRVYWKAELLFLKSMVYYYLAQRFGGLIIDSSATTGNCFYPEQKRSSLSETYSYIITSLQRCTVQLPDVAATGRASKTAALAMLMRVALQAAAYVPENRGRYLDVLQRSAVAILGNGKYVLDTSYSNLFNDFDKGLNSREIVLGVFKRRFNTTFQNTLMQDLVVNQSNEKMRPGYGPPLADRFDGSSKRYPSQNLVDAYLVIDDDHQARRWNETSQYRLYRQGLAYASAVLYNNRDKRFYASIVYDSSHYFNSLILTRDSGNLCTSGRKDGNLISPTGYYVRKSLYENRKLWYLDGSDHHLPVLRLGEVYLNYAEALLLSGKAKEAILLMNVTRTIHGGLPPIDTNIPLSLAWDIYKNERRVEMFFENDRYWSLLRWAKFSAQTSIPELEKPIDAINISANGKTFNIAVIERSGNRERRFSTQRFLLPLPQQVANTNK